MGGDGGGLLVGITGPVFALSWHLPNDSDGTKARGVPPVVAAVGVLGQRSATASACRASIITLESRRPWAAVLFHRTSTRMDGGTERPLACDHFS